MSLAATDLLEIRSIFKEEFKKELDPIRGELEAIRNDIEEIYDRLEAIEIDNKEIHKFISSQKTFKKLSIQDQLLSLNSQLLEAAKQAGIALPR